MIKRKYEITVYDTIRHEHDPEIAEIIQQSEYFEIDKTKPLYTIEGYDYIYPNKIRFLEKDIVQSEYFPIILFFFVALFLATFLLWLSYKLSPKASYPEKLSPYECGFNPYTDARNRFDIRFYLLSILFVIFDIEAALIFPWAISLVNLDSFGFWTMVDFVIELVIGYIYAWRTGALDWD